LQHYLSIFIKDLKKFVLRCHGCISPRQKVLKKAAKMFM
jgi:hypothetical protein